MNNALKSATYAYAIAGKSRFHNKCHNSDDCPEKATTGILVRSFSHDLGPKGLACN